MTHDSFDIGEEVITAFEQANNAEVTILKAGDAGEALTKAILTKSNPTADLFYGVDNTFLGRALDEGIFVPYQSPMFDDVPERLRLDSTKHVMPVDYGYVTLNYDKAWLEQNGLTPPDDLRDLTAPEWRGKLVVQNPATSSPGLAFLLATIERFPERSDYTWQQFWADLRANDVLVTDGWTESYYSSFTVYGGDRPLVVSYATSPAAEVFFSEGRLQEPPTGNVMAQDASFLQIEGIGILQGTENEDLAKKFVDFMMGVQVQEDFPTRMWVYPVNQDAELPEVFRFAEEPQDPAAIDPATIAENREAWIDEWTQIVVR
jgi:thiamine transport system substrate-binding protein